MRVRLFPLRFHTGLLFSIASAIGGEQVLRQPTTRTHQEMARPHGGIANRQFQNLLGTLFFGQRIDRSAHQVFNESTVGVIRSGLLATESGAKNDGAHWNGSAVQAADWFLLACRNGFIIWLGILSPAFLQMLFGFPFFVVLAGFWSDGPHLAT